MMSRAFMLAALAATLSGCSKSDDCARFYDKLVAAARKDQPDDAKILVDQRADNVAKCRKNIDKFEKDPGTKCVLATADGDADAVKHCIIEGRREGERRSPYSAKLDAVVAAAEAYYAAHGAFPIGKAKLLPAAGGAASDTGCCGGPKNVCQGTTAWASDPVWSALGFKLDGDQGYQYSYESVDGKTYRATAAGDTDCDGAIATFTADGSIANGKPVATITKPPSGTF